MESLNSETSGTSMSGMSGFSLSAMSGTSIISSHSLKAGEVVPKQNKISRSIVRSVKEGRGPHIHANTSTPKSHNWRGNDYSNSSLNSLGLSNPGMSPLSPSPPTSPDMMQEKSEGDDRKEPTHPGIPPEVLAFLQKEDAFSPDSVPPPMRLESESPVSIGSQRSSRESLIGGSSSPVAGTVNPAFIDETDDIVSERGLSLAALRRMSPTARNFTNRPSRSPSPGDVFLPNAAAASLGQTSKSSSRGSSPAGKSTTSGKTRRQGSTDSTKGSKQKNRTSPLQTLGHEAIAMKVLQDTMKHMTAVERMQQYSDLQHNREKLRRNSSQDRMSPLEQETKFNTSSSNNVKNVMGSSRNATQANQPVSAMRVESKIEHQTASAESTGAPTSSMVGKLERTGRKAPPPIKAKPPRTLYDNKVPDAVQSKPVTSYPTANGGTPGMGVNRTSPVNGGIRNDFGSTEAKLNSNYRRMSANSEDGNRNSNNSRNSASSSTDQSNKRGSTPPYNGNSIHNTSTLPHTKPLNSVAPPDYRQVMLSRQKTTRSTPSPNSSLDSQARLSPSVMHNTSQYMTNRRPESSLSTNSSMYSSNSSIQSVIHVPTAGGGSTQPARQITPHRQGSIDSNASTDSLGPASTPRTPQTPNKPLVNGGVRTPLSSPRDRTIVTKDGERKIVGQRFFQSSPC